MKKCIIRIINNNEVSVRLTTSMGVEIASFRWNLGLNKLKEEFEDEYEFKIVNPYFLDKEWYDSMADTYYSYEAGAFDNMYFETKEDALRYAKENSCRIDACEHLEVSELEL